MKIHDEFRAERIARLKKWNQAYMAAADRLTTGNDIAEMRSVRVEMKALSDAMAALIEELVPPAISRDS